MNIQEYILSGAVENYVLGLATEEEKTTFENLYSTHPELKAARLAFELALEKQALDEAVLPPAELKSRIFSEIDDLPGDGISETGQCECDDSDRACAAHRRSPVINPASEDKSLAPNRQSGESAEPNALRQVALDLGRLDACSAQSDMTVGTQQKER